MAFVAIIFVLTTHNPISSTAMIPFRPGHQRGLRALLLSFMILLLDSFVWAQDTAAPTISQHYASQAIMEGSAGWLMGVGVLLMFYSIAQFSRSYLPAGTRNDNQEDNHSEAHKADESTETLTTALHCFRLVAALIFVQLALVAQDILRAKSGEAWWSSGWWMLPFIVVGIGYSLLGFQTHEWMNGKIFDRSVALKLSRPLASTLAAWLHLIDRSIQHTSQIFRSKPADPFSWGMRIAASSTALLLVLQALVTSAGPRDSITQIGRACGGVPDIPALILGIGILVAFILVVAHLDRTLINHNSDADM